MRSIRTSNDEFELELRQQGCGQIILTNQQLKNTSTAEGSKKFIPFWFLHREIERGDSPSERFRDAYRVAKALLDAIEDLPNAKEKMY